MSDVDFIQSHKYISLIVGFFFACCDSAACKICYIICFSARTPCVAGDHSAASDKLNELGEILFNLILISDLQFKLKKMLVDTTLQYQLIVA